MSTTTVTTTQRNLQENVVIPKPPTPVRLPSFTEGSGSLIPFQQPPNQTTQTVTTTVNEQTTNMGGVLAYGYERQQPMTLVIDNVERPHHSIGHLASQGNLSEKVVYTTQKIPVEVKTTVVKTTRTYTEDDSVKKTVEVQKTDDYAQRQPAKRNLPVSEPPNAPPPDNYIPYPNPPFQVGPVMPFNPPQPTFRTTSPVVYGPFRMEEPPIQIVRPVGENRRIVKTEVVSMNPQGPIYPPITTIQNTPVPIPPPMFQQTMIQPDTHRQLVGKTMMQQDFVLMPQQYAVQQDTRNGCLKALTCNFCCTRAGGPCCGECCACPGNRICYPGTCQCRSCAQPLFHNATRNGCAKHSTEWQSQQCSSSQRELMNSRVAQDLVTQHQNKTPPETMLSKCKNGVLQCLSCNNCCTVPNGPCCGECCGCPNNPFCYSGTCHCRYYQELCSLI